MKILITGGTGFVGSALVAALTAQGHQCTIVSRAPRNSQDPNVRYCTWDNLAGDGLKLQIESVDAVINLAGESVGGGRWTTARKRAILDSRVHITEHITQAIAAAARKPQVLINASAIGWYASSQESQDESAPAAHSFLGKVVRAWEKAADAAATHTRVVKLRIGLVFGPDGGPLKRITPLFRWGLGGRLGNGQQWMSWIHRDDLVAIILAALTDSGWQGAYNAVAPQPITNLAFTSALAKALRRPAFCHTPAWILRLLLQDMADLLLFSHNITSKHPQIQQFPFKFTGIDQVFRDCLKR